MKYLYVITAGLTAVMTVSLTKNFSDAMLSGIFILLVAILSTVCDIAEKMPTK